MIYFEKKNRDLIEGSLYQIVKKELGIAYPFSKIRCNYSASHKSSVESYFTLWLGVDSSNRVSDCERRAWRGVMRGRTIHHEDSSRAGLRLFLIRRPARSLTTSTASIIFVIHTYIRVKASNRPSRPRSTKINLQDAKTTGRVQHRGLPDPLLDQTVSNLHRSKFDSHLIFKI